MGTKWSSYPGASWTCSGPKRSSMVWSTTRPSMRATWIPRQMCGPTPKVRWSGGSPVVIRRSLLVRGRAAAAHHVGVVGQVRELSAVDRDGVAGDVRRLVRREEQHRVGDVLGLAHARDQALLGDLVDDLRRARAL